MISSGYNMQVFIIYINTQMRRAIENNDGGRM